MKYWIIAIIIGCVGSYGLGRYLQPAKEITVVKEVEVIKRDVKVVERTITRPDGTTETEKTFEDKTSSEKKNENLSMVENLKPQWKVQGLVGLNDISRPTYGVGIERRVWANVFAGAYVNTERQFGLTVSMEF